MRGLNIHENIPVSIIKLTLGLRVGFISSHLTAAMLFPVNPRAITGPPKMSLLLEAKTMPALIIKPRFILVTHMDDLGWCITSNQQGKMFVQNLYRIVRKPNVTPSSSRISPHMGGLRQEWLHIIYNQSQYSNIVVDFIFYKFQDPQI